MRLINFIEFVNGCGNQRCPSWGSVCSIKKQNFMSINTLDKIIKEVKTALVDMPFQKVDFWLYGNGDTLDHPDLEDLLKITQKELSGFGKIAMAIDSRRDVPKANIWKYFDKIKIIHKLPETFDWVERAKIWNVIVTVPKSHKLITNTISRKMWEVWKLGIISELKAVPWHNIALDTDRPVFSKRESFAIETGIPFEYGDYPGLPSRRALIKWNGNLRRCLVCPTQHETIKELFAKEDRICEICWPLTGSELARFVNDKIIITPSANCVSDGYYSGVGISHPTLN